jgi:hypothetical protein
MGSDAHWHKVVQSPDVQRMLKDPQLAGALYQNFRQTGGQMPQPAGPPGQPTMPMRRGGPARFDAGGESMADIDAESKAAQDEYNAALIANDAQAQMKAQGKILELNRKRTAALQQAVTPGPVSMPQSVTPSISKPQNQNPAPPGPISIGGAQVSGSTMQGLQKLGQQGPPTLANVAIPTAVGALMGGASGGGSGAGALIGGATAGLLSYFLRKNAQKQQSQQQSNTSGSGGPTGVTASYDPNATATPTGTRRAMQMQPDGTTKYTTVPYYGDQPSSAGPSAGPSSLPSGPGLWMGTSSQGNVKSSDGKSWQTEDGKPLDPSATVVNQTQVKAFDQPQQTSGLGSQLPNLNAMENSADPDLSAMMPDATEGMREGGLAAAPMHRAPILHTTIVIAAKPKKNVKEGQPVLKAMGGELPQEERRPRKPRAIPPPAGPQAAGARLPHGRVQVPRGSGAAIKGKRFGGVY